MRQMCLFCMLHCSMDFPVDSKLTLGLLPLDCGLLKGSAYSLPVIESPVPMPISGFVTVLEKYFQVIDWTQNGVTSAIIWCKVLQVSKEIWLRRFREWLTEVVIWTLKGICWAKNGMRAPWVSSHCVQKAWTYAWMWGVWRGEKSYRWSEHEVCSKRGGDQTVSQKLMITITIIRKKWAKLMSDMEEYPGHYFLILV